MFVFNYLQDEIWIGHPLCDIATKRISFSNIRRNKIPRERNFLYCTDIIDRIRIVYLCEHDA